MSEVYVLCILLSLQILEFYCAPEVLLPNGRIRGYKDTTIKGTHYYAFQKIPYAAPPVGELRFEAPVPPPNWTETLNTTEMLPSDGTSVSLPVMVYIHGGGFTGGTARNYYADRILNQGVIFVAMNYRLGIFGFTSTQDDVIPGNYALKDQQMAFKWVHDNIHLFGGDPNKVTIFGQSAGSASVAYHLLNEQSKGLFQGAILESGTFLSPWAFQRNPKDVAFGTAAILNETFQTNRDSKELLTFLREVDAYELNLVQANYSKLVKSLETSEITQGFHWAPVIEPKNPNAIVTKKMYGLLQSGNVVAVPILIGMTSEESLDFNKNSDQAQRDMVSYDKNLSWLVPNDMEISDEANRTLIGTKIRDIYTEGEPLSDHVGDGIRYCSDTSFTRSIIRTAEIYSQFADTYFYQFSYDGERGHQTMYYDGAEREGHSQEKHYMFCHGKGCDLSAYLESDQTTSDRLIRFWTNFAKYQNPTPEPNDDLLQNITWPLVNVENGDFFYVDINEDLEVRNHPKEATWMDRAL